MAAHSPSYPRGRPRSFRATVHGTVFGERATRVDSLHAGDRLLLIADPVGEDEPGVWLHLEDGAPIGHLPPEISTWLWPWLHAGGKAVARALRVHGQDVPSWRRLVVQVECRGAA